jgi:Metal-dependent hydrolases of the beta-lactamase superfamily III
MVRGIATALALMTVVVTQAVAPARADDARMKVTLVGTGGPEYFPDRLGISTLVEANGEMLLFDVGAAPTSASIKAASTRRISRRYSSPIFTTIISRDCPISG